MDKIILILCFPNEKRVMKKEISSGHVLQTTFRKGTWIVMDNERPKYYLFIQLYRLLEITITHNINALHYIIITIVYKLLF